MREVDVIGVRVEMPSNQPIVLLREVAGDRYLPIWIGAVEATAIAFAQQGVVPPRPLTHDLIKDLLVATGNDLSEVRITEMKDGVFYAVLVFGSGVEVSARPSDSIALALRTGSKIVCADDVLEATGNELSEVRITDVKDGVFFATLVFDSGAEVSARPSDSIALALRTGTTIFCAEDVLDEAGLAVPAEQEDEVEKFREFLDHVSPEDFEAL